MKTQDGTEKRKVHHVVETCMLVGTQHEREEDELVFKNYYLTGLTGPRVINSCQTKHTNPPTLPL